MNKNNLVKHNIKGDYMFYLNCFFIYSILGYFLETLVAVVTKTNFRSGILSFWWTPVYGIGAVTILFISKYLFKNLHMNRFLETIIMFFVVGVVLSFIEALGGVLIEKIFGEVFWNYDNHKYHIGHYISLEMSLIWGASSVVFVYIINPLLKGLIKKIPSFITIILVGLFFYDLTKTTLYKIANKK